MAGRDAKEVCRGQLYKKRVKDLCRSRILFAAAGILLLGYPMLGIWADEHFNRNPYGLVVDTEVDTTIYEKVRKLENITDENIVRQYFTTDAGSIEAIRLCKADYGQEKTGMLSACLKDARDHRVLKTWEIDMENQAVSDMKRDAGDRSGQSEIKQELLQNDESRHGDYLILGFEDMECELSGQKYVLELSLRGTVNDMPFYMTQEDVYPDGDLVIDGRRQEGDLCFQVVTSVQVRSFRRTKFWMRFYAAAVLDLILYFIRNGKRAAH